MRHLDEKKFKRKYEIICGIWDWLRKNPDVISDPYEFISPYDPIEVRRRKPRAQQREERARWKREAEEELERLERNRKERKQNDEGTI